MNPPRNKKKPHKKTTTGDLFNNPMVELAKKNMTPEQIEEYKKIGEYMYSNMDLCSATNTPNNLPTEMLDALDYIVNSIQSGQHISTLEENEKMLLKEAYGDTWFERFGYSVNDLTEIR